MLLYQILLYRRLKREGEVSESPVSFSIWDLLFHHHAGQGLQQSFSFQHLVALTSPETSPAWHLKEGGSSVRMQLDPHESCSEG